MHGFSGADRGGGILHFRSGVARAPPRPLNGLTLFLLMSRQFWILIAVLVVATAIYYPFSPGGRQSRNMKLAEQHIVSLKPQFAADPRFAELTLVSFTGEGGSLLVHGEVAMQADADAANALIKASNPPCPVAFRVRVRPTSTPAARPQE